VRVGDGMQDRVTACPHRRGDGLSSLGSPKHAAQCGNLPGRRVEVLREQLENGDALFAELVQDVVLLNECQHQVGLERDDGL
jgi:hypothetical protein